MPNDYFQFKQFTVSQSQCAMKVTTDGCTFGALMARDVSKASSILDIGTGTGLLAMMIAQQNPSASILGLEIDTPAATQAKENVQNSPFENHIHIQNLSLQEFVDSPIPSTFDVIVSNPPFFHNNLQGSNAAKNVAVHGDKLSQRELIDGLNKLLSPNGTSFVMYPEWEMKLFLEQCQNSSLFPHKMWILKENQEKKALRWIAKIARKQANELITTQILIRDKDNSYTNEFRDLLKDYYLAF